MPDPMFQAQLLQALQELQSVPGRVLQWERVLQVQQAPQSEQQQVQQTDCIIC